MFSLAECYRILGVSPRAETDEVKRRFRLLALKFHPDRNPGNDKAAVKFRRIAAAYQAICQHRQRVAAGEPQEPSRPRFRSESRRAATLRRAAMSDFFGLGEEDLEDLQDQGPDFRYDLQIPFTAAVWGTTQTIEFQRLARCAICQGSGVAPGSGYQACSACDGKGRKWRTSGELRLGPVCEVCHGEGRLVIRPCPGCQGQGYRTHRCRYQITIPPGVEDGTRLFISGAGGEGFSDGPPGHLVVVIHIEPHEVFTRRGRDLYCQIPIPWATAVRGGQVEVPTLMGSQLLQLPRGTNSGQQFILPGLGIPGPGGARGGDLIVTVFIAEPHEYQAAVPDCQPEDFWAAAPDLGAKCDAG